MKLTLEVAGNDTIAFFRKVSSEADYDFLEFYIDNVKKAEWAGEVPWSRVAYPVTEGEHTFRWVYIKDVYVVSGSDCAWVDYIELPALVDETMTVNAGADAYSCVGADFQTSAFAQNYVSLLWTSSGTGVFNNAAALNAIYTPSAGDYTAGNVTLNLTVYGNGGQMLTDAMILTFLTLPGGAGMITGDTWACMEGANQYSTGLIGGADWYSWVLTPATAGVITGNGTMVTVNWAVGFVGMASLEVQGMNSCGGGTFSPAVTIQVDDCTGVGENSTKNDFIIAPNPGNGLFSISPANKIGEFDIRVVNTTGQLVYTTRFNSADKHELDLSQLNEGVYFIHLINSNSRYIEKLIIQK